jgi:hypothetical protein
MTHQPPPQVAAFAASYRCGHCNSDPAEVARDEYGIWRLAIGHDDGCPVLAGAVSDIPDTFRALKESA